MKSLSSLLGWLLLVVVLAVPSFLFYNWWAKSRQQSSAEISQQQAPSNIFSAAQKSSGTVRASLSAAPDVHQAVYSSTRSAAPVQDAPGPAAQPAQAHGVAAAAVTAVPVAVSTASSQAVAVSTQTKKASFFNPKGDRDPTLSPEDYRRIKDLELQKKDEEERQIRDRRKAQKKDSCESKLRLQGIVGSAVIVNGEMYYVGQTIYGAKIIKIGADYIIGECKGKRFKKGL